MSLVAVVRTESDARRHVMRIRLTAGVVRENLPKLVSMIQEAQQFRDDQILGYASWTAYVSDVFSDEPLRLPREERQELVAILSGEGMSTRAIAPIVGVSNETVAQDIKAGVRNLTPALSDKPGHVTKLTGSDSVAVNVTPDLAPRADDWVQPGEVVNTETGEVIDAPTTITETHTVKTVMGLDGKTYNTKPAAPRRHSLVDDAYKANTDLWKAIERIRTITGDDRFTRNKADILAALQPSVDLALEVLNNLVNP